MMAGNQRGVIAQEAGMLDEMRPIGYRKDGSPVWPISGGEGEGSGTGGSGDGSGQGGSGGSGDGGDGSQGDGGLTLEQSQAELGRTRREAAGYRTRLRTAEETVQRQESELADLRSRLETLERGNQGGQGGQGGGQGGGSQADAEREARERREREQRDARIRELESQIRDDRMQGAVVAEAARRNFLDPEDAWGLVDRTLLDWDDENIPRADSVKAAIEDLSKRKKHLLKPKTDPHSPTNPDRGSGGSEREGLYGPSRVRAAHEESARKG